VFPTSGGGIQQTFVCFLPWFARLSAGFLIGAVCTSDLWSLYWWFSTRSIKTTVPSSSHDHRAGFPCGLISFPFTWRTIGCGLRMDTAMFRQYTVLEISQADSLPPVVFRRDVTVLEKRRLRRQKPRLHNVRMLSVENLPFGICIQIGYSTWN
jgi:hypothetical protein